MKTLILFALLLSSCSQDKKNASDGEAVAIRKKIIVGVQTLERKDYLQYAEHFGRVEALQSAELVVSAGGRVRSVTAEDGAWVKKGQELCDIDGSLWSSRLQAAKVAEKMAREEFERQVVHLEKGSSSQLMLDRSRLEHLNMVQALREVEIAREAAFCVSPISGRVLRRHVDVHSQLPPGTRTFSLMNDSRVKIFVDVPEGEVSDYAKGSPVEVWSRPGAKSQKGKIHAVSLLMHPKKRTFRLEIRLNNRDRKFVPGVMVRVRLLQKKWQDVAVVPLAALVTRGGETVVYEVKDGVAHRHSARVLASDEWRAALETDLTGGALFVVRGSGLVSDSLNVLVEKARR